MNARGDLAFGIGIIAIAALMLTVVIPVGIDSPGQVDILALSPSFWPNIIMVLMGLIGLVVTARAALALARARPTAAADGESSAREAGTGTAPWRGALRVLACVLLLFGFQRTLETLGLLLPSVVVITALVLLGGERRVHFIIPIAIGVPVALYLFFTHVAVVQIPLGILEEWIR